MSAIVSSHATFAHKFLKYLGHTWNGTNMPNVLVFYERKVYINSNQIMHKIMKEDLAYLFYLDSVYTIFYSHRVRFLLVILLVIKIYMLW